MRKILLIIIRILFRIAAWIYWFGLIGIILFSSISYVPLGMPDEFYLHYSLKNILYSMFLFFINMFPELLIKGEWVLFLPAILYFTGRYIYRRFYR